MTLDAAAARAATAKPPYRHPLTGAILPGVTTVLDVLHKPDLVPWANRLGLQGLDVRRYVEDLAEVGRCAHALILELLSQGRRPCNRRQYTPDQVERAERSLAKFLRWRAGHRLVTWHCERDMVSVVHAFGGTPDWVGLLDDTLVVLDFKTGHAIHQEHLYQAVAYLELVAEATGERPQAARILQVGRDEREGFSERTIDDPAELGAYWQLFQHCLGIYRLQHGEGHPGRVAGPRPRGRRPARRVGAALDGSGRW